MDLSLLTDAGVTCAASVPPAAHFDVLAWLSLPATSLPGQPAHWLVLLTALYVVLEAGLKRAKIPPNSPLEALANLIAMVPGVGALARPWTSQAAQTPDPGVKP